MIVLDPAYAPYAYGLTFIIGLCVGSFLNVVAHRFLTEQSIVSPASHCPACQRPLAWFENIPLLSWLVLRGHCRTCHAPIGWEHPVTELATGLLFVGVLAMAGLSWQALLLAFFMANLVVITLTDLKESLIFQINSLSLIPAGLAYQVLNFWNPVAPKVLIWGVSVPESLVSALIAIVAAFVFFEGLILLSQKLFGAEGFGHGDTHLMMGVGAFLGAPFMLLALGLGFVLQSALAIPILVVQWIQRRDYVSLGSGALGVGLGLLPLWIASWPIQPLALRTALAVGCLILCLVCLLVFLRRMKESQTFTYMPLGPALVLGTLIALFAGQFIVGAYLQHWL